MRSKTEKADVIRFMEGAKLLLKKLGAVTTDENRNEFRLETRGGPLRVHLLPNSTGGPGTAYCRFEDAAKANALLNPRKELSGELNPYSSKWNWSYFDPWSVDEALVDFTKQLRRVL